MPIRTTIEPCRICGDGPLALGYKCNGCDRVGVTPNAKLDALAAYLLTEADFSRSWTDGRRGADVPKSEAYNARRIEIAEEREAWVAEIADLRARLAGAEAASIAVREPLVDHAELTGHIEIVEQCRDYLDHEATDGGDPSGKLRDFVESLRIVVDQLDRQRRSRNWYEVAYTAGKQKLIESAVDKALAAARDAAQRLVEQVEHLGAFADDNDPRVMSLSGPISAAHVDLWIALGLDLDKEAERLRADIDNRCAVCGWPLAMSRDEGTCVRGNCSMRPRPERLYAPARAAKEASGV